MYITCLYLPSYKEEVLSRGMTYNLKMWQLRYSSSGCISQSNTLGIVGQGHLAQWPTVKLPDLSCKDTVWILDKQ